MSTNIMLVGVGGQGTLLASKILGDLLTRRGQDVKVSEVHGMAQRGGSVVTYVKYGDAVHSPVIDLGQADVIVGFEILEAYRYLPYLKNGGKILASSQQVKPMPVVTGAMAYPSGIEDGIKACAGEFCEIDALALAQRAGSVKSVNVVLLGLLAKNMDVGKEEWLTSLKNIVPAKFLDMNLKAFELGYAA